MPVHDWQFWVVTLAAILAGAWLLRGVIPGLKKKRPPGKRTTLTIGGKAAGKS
jgi:hypothetical protein